MKAIIDSKRYDTDTATKIASDSFGYPNDFSHWEETLYVTSKGNYFLHGSGGAMSRYCTQVGNKSFGGGSEIIPMTREKAAAWCEEHNAVDATEEHFNDLVEDA